MKSYKNLFSILVSEENIKTAICNASKGKRKEKCKNKRKRKRNNELLKDIYENKDSYIKKFQEICENYKNSNHTQKEIYDGITRKKRTIIVPTAYEQVVHHMVVNVLKPIFMKPLYEHSYGSIPGVGAHAAKKRIKKWVQKDVKNTRYCLKMDIKKFFESIPHDILKNKLFKIIKDEKFISILFTIIDVQDVGIPLGFYTSQWLANFYLTAPDHYIKERLHAKYYVRYMDDMVIFDGNKRTLHVMRKEIESYLRKNLGLVLKENWHQFKIEYRDKEGKTHGRPLDFMGFKFYRNRTTLRRSIMLRISRKARKISKKEHSTIHDCRQIMSYLGWISSTDTYSFYVTWVKPYISFRRMKRKISTYDRRLNQLCGTNQNIAYGH